MGPSNCVKPIGNISLQKSTEVSVNAVNWGMKAHQQAAVLRSDQRVACMSQRGSALCICMPVCECVSRNCLDEQSWEARSVSERRREEEDGGHPKMCPNYIHFP